MPFRAQAEVDAIGLAKVGVRRQKADDLADHAAVELLGADAADAAAARLAVLVVNEHQVDVAAVVQLLAAMLAKGEDHAAYRLIRISERLAEAIADVPQGGVQGHFQGGVGDAGNVAGDLLEWAVGDDVVGADA